MLVARSHTRVLRDTFASSGTLFTPIHATSHAPRTTFSVSTDDRLTTVDVTDRVLDAIPDDCEDGVCTVFVEHTTAALVLQKNEPRLRGDLETFLSDLVPDEGHAHDELDGNSVERRSTSVAV